MGRRTKIGMDNKIVKFLIERNKEQSEEFRGAEASLDRRRYRGDHPTEIAALKCMDGRLNLAVITETPPGIIQPFRNIGGKFDLGWPFFGETMGAWVEYATDRGRRCLVIASYHFSKGDVHRGCAGHGYDTAAAKTTAFGLKAQIERVFGKKHGTVYPVVIGIETDEDALVLHGENGETLDLSQVAAGEEEELRHTVESLYPDMEREVLVDFMPLIRGNIAHVAKIRASKRPITDAEHKEQVLAIGRGFDWMHEPNKALIVGPYSYDLSGPIGTAGKLLLSNLNDGRVPEDDGIVLLCCGLYREESGPESLRATEKALSLAKFARAVLAKEVPDLTPYLQVMTGIVNQNTRLMTRIPFQE